MKSTTVPLYKETKRLILRHLEPYDYENWSQAFSSMRPPQSEWDETSWTLSELTKAKFKEKLRKELKRRAADSAYELSVFRKDDGMLIGHVAIDGIIRGNFQNGVLGYRIFNNFWGEGYATEACAAAMQLAFKELKLHRVEAFIEPDNKPSLKVAKKIKLRKEGLSIRRVFFKKKWIDLSVFAATSEDYGIKYKFPLK
ncbi:GNAT family N-acetyltransferase [Bdellovibrio sp. KM01]|uniref:GNAT family N-acetyltransferase n=1 Tax=Bdellovibrio sp. KM01 TaxID=2748865 RepID=UPI0015E91B15|nr:GNAT family N-acetyltransferase [Bdellovibrio sp. KM01]QLY24307.1 GNAT family N-acetyltransferase [Bdellovibrio sp. KM01]